MASEAYKQAGVDPSKINPFKDMMGDVAKATLDNPVAHQCRVFPDGTWKYVGSRDYRNAKPVLEGLGNKNWIAEWMYQFDGTDETSYANVAFCCAMMAVNDMVASGGMPVTYNDEVAAGDSEWFTDMKRAKDFANGIRRACDAAKMALVGGESPSLKYLVRAQEPIKSAPSLSGCVTGIHAPEHRRHDGSDIRVGDIIIGVRSNGWHANGYSLIIREAMKLQDKFLTKLPNGRTLGFEALRATKCYVDLVKIMNESDVEIHGYQPATGDGVSKIAFHKRPFTYCIDTWPAVPVAMRYFHEALGIPLLDCLTTFNWGIGYYLFVPKGVSDEVLRLAYKAGYETFELGVVREGERCVIFGPANKLRLPPPGE